VLVKLILHITQVKTANQTGGLGLQPSLFIFVVTTKHKQTTKVHARAFKPGNWKQWKRKPEMENGNGKWKQLKLDANEC